MNTKLDENYQSELRGNAVVRTIEYSLSDWKIALERFDTHRRTIADVMHRSEMFDLYSEVFRPVNGLWT